MMHLISILPALGCVAMMLGGGFAVRLLRRTPLARLPLIARKTLRLGDPQ
jgi:hypothetical protein